MLTWVLDSPPGMFGGMNYIHFAPWLENYMMLPIIPPKHAAARGWPGGDRMINGWEGEYIPTSEGD